MRISDWSSDVCSSDLRRVGRPRRGNSQGASRGQSGFGSDQDDVVIMPIKTVQRRFKGDQDVDTIMVAVDDDYDTTAVQNSIEQLLRERRHITGGTQDDFNVFDTTQISETLSGTTQILTALLGEVAAVS